jgi:shikimate kinase
LKKFLIIGPSGIGKSTALNSLNLPMWETICLDKALANDNQERSASELLNEFGMEKFSNKSIEFIEKYTFSKNCIFDVGAGSIAFLCNHSWFIKQNTIALFGDPEIIYPRSDRQKFHSTLEFYKISEFNKNRMELYNNCKFKIDVTKLNKDQVREEIITILKSYNPI